MNQEEAIADLHRVEGHYRTEKHNLRKDFFGRCLKYFSKYRRAAGYFASSALRTWVSALPRLAIERDAIIQLLISPKLSKSDIEALSAVATPQQRAEIAHRSIDDFIRDVVHFAELPESADDEQLRARLLAWLIAHNRLQLRFAINLYHEEEAGIFHKKIGIFNYPWGDTIAFTGSANESRAAHEINSESVDVYRSWVAADRERINTKIEEFEEVWSGVPSVLVLGLSEKTMDYVRSISPDHPPVLVSHSKPVPVRMNESSSKLWDHQKVAIEAFLGRGNGILEMATGTGKTVTALEIASRLRADAKIDSLIVCMEGTDLLKQWFLDLSTWVAEHGFHRLYQHYGGYHEREPYLLNPKGAVLLISRTALAPVLRDLRESRGLRIMIIHDEVHDSGSPSAVANLAGQRDVFAYRLGLSATPERAYDTEGNQFIELEVGPIIYRFGIEDAIEAGILCPFQYFALPYHLTSEDKRDLQKVYQRQAGAEHSGQPWSDEQLWIELSKVYKKARSKVPIFSDFVGKQPDGFFRWCIMFVEDREFAESLYPIVHRYTHRFSAYYSDDDTEVLRRFIRGELDCLITCHKISQGIDVRSLEKVVLFASSRSKLETIQRLGRCLRTNPLDPQKIATVVDFVLADDNNEPDKNGVDYDRYVWFRQLSTLRPKKTHE